MSGARVRGDCRADSSTLPIGQADIGFREFGDEQAGVFSAFRGAQFEMDRHFVLPIF